MNRTNNKNYAQAAAQQKNNKQASHTINPSHQNQQHHHQQVSQQNQASGPPTSSNYSSSANGKSINNSQTKPQTPHNSTMGNGNTGRSASIKQQKNSVTLPTNGHSWETAPTSLVFGSIKNTSNAQISSLPSSTSQTLTSGGGLPTTLPTKGVPTFGSLPTNTTTTPTTQATQATQATPTTVGTSGPGVNNINNNNNNNNSNGTSKSISARANEIPRTHSAPPLFQDSNNRNVGQSGHTSNVVPARTQPNNNIHQQQSTAVPPHQQSSASVNNPPLNHRKDSVSSTVSSNDGQPQFHPHHSPHHPPNHTNQHGHPAFRQHPQHHNTHKPIQQIYRPRDKQHPSPHLNPAQQPVPTQQSAMPMGPPPPHMFQMYPNHRGVVQYYMDYTGYPVAPHNMYSIPPYVPQRPPPMSQPIPPVNNVSFQKPTTNKAIQIIDPNKGAPIQIHTNNNIIQRQQQNYKREETPSAVPDKKTKESDKERPNSEDKGFSKAVPIVDPAEKNKEREEREKKERDEQERLAKEKEERERKEREERLEQERIAKEKEEQERKEREEREEQERLAKEKEERERKEREERLEQERIAKEKEEQERIEREEREKREREEQERLAKEKEERERKELEERLEQERLAKEKEEQERKEREEQERLAKEKEERERKEREEQERIAKEKEEQERKEREERERLELERIAKEKEEQERKEKEEREERERLEAAERIEKERKEAEEKALKEQEEKVLKEEDIEKKEEEEPKAKATPEEEAEKKKKAETLDKKDDKKEEKKRPGPLDLSRTTSAPAIPSAPLSALGSARIIDDLSSIQYPHGIKSPNPELNSNAEPGKFKYDRTFLMQFMTVCKEKPENLPALEAIGMEESKDDKKRTNTRSNSGPRTSSLHKGSPNQSQFSQMGEFKFTPLKTSEERFAASMRNGMPASGIFGRTALGRTGSGSTLLPPSAAMTPPSPGRTPSGRNRDNRRTGKGSHQMQGNMGQEHIAPLERTENRWVPQILNNGSNGSLPKSESESIPFESVQRKVKALLNKLTLEKFDSISDQIIDFANKSRDERDGRILREVIRLIFEKSCDESNFCAMYAQLCRKMMERVDPEIVDENVKNTEGKFVQGGTLFRKYLLNRCQEEFEKGWKVNVPVPSNEKGEPDLLSDEYYVAARAKRQGLGLIRFIGELFKLNMLTERIMHECIKKLLIFQGSPEEEEMESLCKLMNTVGEQLDHVKPNPHEQMKSTQLDHAKAKKYMESYFDRMEEISKLPNLSSRIKFMLMDVMDLRSNAWKPRRDINAPKTIAEIHEDAAKQKEEAEYLRRTTSSGGRGMPKMSEQMSRSGSSRQHRSDKGMIQSPDGWSTVGGSSSQRNKEKVGDLTKFGSVNRSKIVSLAPGGILGGLSGGAKGWSKSDNKDPNDKPVGLNRANSTTNIYSVLNSESSEGRKSSESNSSDTQKPSPPTERKKLILAPRTLKNSPPEEPVKLASKSTSGSASSSQTTEELDSKKICNSIVNMVEEYFSIWDNREVITCLKEDTPVAYHPKAIETFANKVIEKKQKDVDNVMKLFKEIVSSSTCDIDAFKDGFKATLEFLMDIGADAPMAYSFTGQLLFSTGLDFRDITELLKPLDDDMTTEKVVKGYAEALKNDVDEQNYIQKINEFDLKSLFLKKNKDDINKYIEDLGGSSKK